MPPSPFLCRPAYLTYQSGMGTTGFLLLALPILLLGLGGIDLAHGLFVRQALSHALIEAGRAATVDHAHPDTLVRAFERALHPLFLRAESLQHALAQRHRDTAQAPWQIRIIQPRRSAFTDHADPDARVAGDPPGQRAINHDYQALQHQRRLSEGWFQGRGPASKQTIFEANTLTLELIWPHEPLVPGIKALIRALSPSDDSYRSRLMAHGYLPILRGVSLSMQSHPVDWPDRSDGKVIHGEMNKISPSPLATCTGFWSRCTAPDVLPQPSRPIGPAEHEKGSERAPDIEAGQGHYGGADDPGHTDQSSSEPDAGKGAPTCDTDGCC